MKMLSNLQDISSAFRILIEKVETETKFIEQRGAEAFKQGNLTTAGQLLEIANKLNELNKKETVDFHETNIL